MLTEKPKLSTISCFFFENIVGSFVPQKCRKSVFSKLEVLAPWFSETAKMLIAKLCSKHFYDYC